MSAETEEVPEDFVDISIVPPTLLMSPPVDVEIHTLAIPASLVAEALA